MVGERSTSLGPPRPKREDFCRPRAGATPKSNAISNRRRERLSDSCSGDTGKLEEGARGSANARRALGRRGPSEKTFAAPEPARHQSRMRSSAWHILWLAAQKLFHPRFGLCRQPPRCGLRSLPLAHRPPRVGFPLWGETQASIRCRHTDQDSFSADHSPSLLAPYKPLEARI